MLSIAALAAAAPAQAVLIEYNWTGTVQNNASDKVIVRSDGCGGVNCSNESIYNGNPFNFPYEIGSLITFAFAANLPIESTPPSADGIYRFNPNGNGSRPVSFLRSITGPEDPSAGGFKPSSELFLFGYELIYDSNAGVPDDQRLKINLAPNSVGGADRKLNAEISTPGYFYDLATQQINPGNTANARGRCGELDREGCSTLAIGEYSAIITSIPLLSEDQFAPGRLNRRGSFGDINMTGQWNVPVITTATQVPEPSSILIFGLGAGALAWRRRSRRKLLAAE